MNAFFGGLKVTGFALLALHVLILATPADAERAGPEYFAGVVATDPELFEIYTRTLDSDDKMWQPGNNPTREQWEQFRALRRQPREAGEAAHIMDALFKAYAAEPPDWPVLAVGMRCAEVGVTDTRLVQLAENILLRMDEIPSNRFGSVSSSMRILASTGQAKYTELLKHYATEAIFGEVSHPDEGRLPSAVFQMAVSAVHISLPADRALEVLEELLGEFAKRKDAPALPDDEEPIVRPLFATRYLQRLIKRLKVE